MKLSLSVNHSLTLLPPHFSCLDHYSVPQSHRFNLINPKYIILRIRIPVRSSLSRLITHSLSCHLISPAWIIIVFPSPTDLGFWDLVLGLYKNLDQANYRVFTAIGKQEGGFYVTPRLGCKLLLGQKCT